MTEAPIFTRAYDLHGWLLDRLDGPGGGQQELGYPTLRRSVLGASTALLESVSLALARFDTHDRLVEADQQAILLRVHLRLATDRQLLDDRQLLHASGELADIGRQIGGWLRRLENVE